MINYKMIEMVKKLIQNKKESKMNNLRLMK
jgi:hypothetical protein